MRTRHAEAVIGGVAVEAMDQFVVLDPAFRIEAADLDHRFAAERRESAGDQQQAFEPRPGVAAEKLRTYS